MKRKVLLIEPNYKNKYPPMGLMKLSTYHKMLGDDVRFFKGEFIDFILEEIYEEILIKLKTNDNSVYWEEHKALIQIYIKLGFEKHLKELQELSNDLFVYENLKFYRDYYKKKKYLSNPRWDRICISTLFTFYWSKTINTINSFKGLCKDLNEVWVGGVAASVVPIEVERETGIKPVVGLMDKPGVMDNNDTIIDQLPLDYSILNEIDYVYPENNAYYGYMTRGCVNKCSFCAVPKIEPKYCGFIGIKEQIKEISDKFGEKRNLLLLDNNVLASERFNDIIEEIKECGFAKDAKFIAPNQYNVAIKGLVEGYNDRGYINKIISLYKILYKKSRQELQEEIYNVLDNNKLLKVDTAKKEAIISVDNFFKPLFEKIYTNKPVIRYVDFNQGIDARLVNEEKMKKLAEIEIRPLRIAFDSWKYRKVYEKAIRIAASNGIKNMSNYLLYNYNEEPIDLYLRLKLNVDLCEELNVNIYSFPMKYHPIQDPDYFRDRTYIGIHWNRKFIRAIQAILNSTKGKIGKGKSFFDEAFGKDEAEFEKLLYMPEALIVYRFFYKENGITQKWWEDFNSLSPEKLIIAKNLIQKNNFENIGDLTDDKEILDVLKYYTIRREDAEKELKLEDENRIN